MIHVRFFGFFEIGPIRGPNLLLLSAIITLS